MITWNADLPFLFLKKEMNKDVKKEINKGVVLRYGITNSFL